MRGRARSVVVAWGWAWALLAPAACAHDEGAPSDLWVHTLTIDGARGVSQSDIRDKLATRPTGWWPLARKQWFDAAALDLDLQRIPALYADRGYFDARVVSHDVRRDGKSNAVDIVITVEENLPTKIERVELRGLPAQEEPRASRIARREKVRQGETFDYGRYQTVKSGVQNRLQDNGYAFAEVTGQIAVDRDHHRAAVELQARPGPQVRMGDTQVVGNGGIPAHAILNRVAWRRGDLYDPDDLDTTQRRIYELGVFSSVRLRLPETPTDVANVQIQVTRGMLHELKLGGGAGIEAQREEVRLRAEWTINNFLGGLRQLRMRLRPAYAVIPSLINIQRKGFAANNDVQLMQPDVFGTKVSLQALVGFDVGIADGYQNYGPRTQLGVERPFLRDRLLTGLSYNLQHLNFFNVDQDVFNDASSQFFGFQDPYSLAFVEEFAQIDLRDRPIDPRRGAYLSIYSEQSTPGFGADFHYLKVTPEARVYLPASRRIVIAGRALFGWLHTWGGDTSPITRRYSLGGPSSHRGFGLGRLAPQVPDNEGRLIPVGGDAEALFSLEARIALTKVSGNWLGMVLFVDSGDVPVQLSDLDFGDLNHAVGASLEYTTLIGIVRTGLGVRINRLGPGNPDPGERFAYHITIGEAF